MNGKCRVNESCLKRLKEILSTGHQSLLCFVSLEPIILRIEFSKESQGVVLSDEMKEELFNKYIFNQL